MISHTIGEMTTPIEIYICERKEGFKKFSVIWFMEKTIANEFIKKKWSQKLFILPRHILEPIYILFRSHKIFDIFLVDYSKEPKEVKRTLYENTVKRIDDKNVLLKHKPSIDFNFEEKKLGNDYLKKIGLQNKAFFTFASRSSQFKNEKILTARNSNIYNKIPALKFMISKGYNAIRMGKNETKKARIIADYIAGMTDRYALLEYKRLSSK